MDVYLSILAQALCRNQHFELCTYGFLGIASVASLFFQLDDVPIVEESTDWFETALGLQRPVPSKFMPTSFVNKYYYKAITLVPPEQQCKIQSIVQD